MDPRGQKEKDPSGKQIEQQDELQEMGLLIEIGEIDVK